MFADFARKTALDFVGESDFGRAWFRSRARIPVTIFMLALSSSKTPFARVVATLSFVALLSATTSVTAQVLEWARVSSGSYGSPQLSIRPVSMADAQTAVVDSTGNTYVAEMARQPMVSEWISDIYVVKFGGDGAVLWRRRLEGRSSGVDRVSAITVDAEGDVVLAGESSSLRFGTDLLVAKLDGDDGSLLWLEQRRAHAEYERINGRSLAVAPTGDIIVAATDSSGEPGCDMLILKLSGATGQVLWEQQYVRTMSSGWSDQVSKVVLDEAGNPVIAGTTRTAISGTDATVIKLSGETGAVLWQVHLTSGAGLTDEASIDVEIGSNGVLYLAAVGTRDTTGADFLTVALSLGDGVEVWRNWYSGPDGALTDTAHAMSLSAAGNVFVSGTSASAMGGKDFATVAYHGDTGAELWNGRYDEPSGHGDDEAVAVEADWLGDVVVSGISRTVGTATDYLTLKYSGSDGQLIWSSRYSQPDGSMHEYISDMLVSEDGDVRVVGVSHDQTGLNLHVVRLRGVDGAVLWAQGEQSALDEPEFMSCDDWENKPLAVDFSGASASISCARSVTGLSWIATKYSADGAVVWRRQVDAGGSAPELIADVALDSSGTVFLTGLIWNDAAGYDIQTLALSGFDGSTLWKQVSSRAGDGFDEGRSIHVSASGSIYVAANLDRYDATHDVGVIAYRTDGVELWKTDLKAEGGLTDANLVVDLAEDPMGNLIVLAKSQYYGGSYSLAKLSSAAGEPLWVSRYPVVGPGSEEELAGLAIDSQGNVVVLSGTSEGTPAGGNIHVVKFRGVDGSVAWTKLEAFNSTLPSHPSTVAADVGGDVIYVGTVARDTTGWDLLVRKLSGSNGQVLWSAWHDGTADNTAQSGSGIVVMESGDVVVSGYSEEFPPRAEAIFGKYRATNGEELWRHQEALGANATYPRMLLRGSDDSIYVGASVHTDRGARIGVMKLRDAPAPNPLTLFADSFD